MKIIKITIFLALLLFFYITTVSFIFAAQCKPHQKPVFDCMGFLVVVMMFAHLAKHISVEITHVGITLLLPEQFRDPQHLN